MEVIIYNLKGKALTTTRNIKEASLLTNIPFYEVKECLQNKRNYVKRYQFRYKYGEKYLKKINSVL